MLGLTSAVSGAEHGVILQYHHIDAATPAATSTRPGQFVAQLDYLTDQEFRVLPLDRLLAALQSGQPLPGHSAAITFDDAYRSVYTRAWPELHARGWPFTVFVSTDGVDRGLPGLLSWDQMREMRDGGVSFGNHSRSHDHLIRRHSGESEADWRQRVSADLTHAQNRLDAELGPTPRLFAYPYGEYDDTLAELVQELGYAGLGQHSGPVGRHSDPSRLPRFPLGGVHASLDGFADKMHSLPLPVLTAAPSDPLLPLGLDRPQLRLDLGSGEYDPASLACYVSGQGRGNLQRKGTKVSVQAEKPLPVGRSRYNCTARHRSENRFFWYSHPWIRRRPDGSWWVE